MYFPPAANSATSSTADSACDADNEPRFYPPLWQQRRNLARRILDENHATSVIDFGCGEAALISLLIWETTGDYPITRLAGVELSEDRLQLAREACQPQDFELGANLRVNELTIDLFQGSVEQPDQRLIGFDALVCLEVVEHLDPPVLEKFWSVVLGALKPKIVIVSTPNAEFNIYFPQLNYGKPNAIFRNDDHRFEWTRQEFQDWCNAAAGQYGYDVTYTGAGALPGYNPEVGLCTQFAILHAQNPSQQPALAALGTNTEDQPYHLFSRVEYPIYKEQHSEDKILEYLHEKIACIRPRLPEPYEGMDDAGYHNETSYGHAGGDHGEKSSCASSQPDNASSNVTLDDPPSEPSIELGVVLLEDLWIILGVRQRCKTKINLIRILGQSSLVRVEQEAGLVQFDEDNPYWKKADISLEAPYSQDNEHSPRGSDNGDWSDSSFYKDDYNNFEGEDEAGRKPYGLAYQYYTDQEEQQADVSPDDRGWSAWSDPPVTEYSPEWYSPK